MDNNKSSSSNLSSPVGTPAGGQKTGSYNKSGSGITDKVSDVLAEGGSKFREQTAELRGDLSDEMAQLRRDMNAMQETITNFVSKAGAQASKTAQSIGSTVVEEVGASAGQVVETASQQVKTFASELETMAKRNPLGTLAGTLVTGVVLGMMCRSRH